MYELFSKNKVDFALNRNAQVFKIVLEYLRSSGEFKLSENETALKQSFMDELKFWGIHAPFEKSNPESKH